MTLWGLITLAGCGGHLVQERAIPMSTGQADLTWATTAPEGQASLWLHYELHADTRRAGASGSEPVYHIEGSLTVTSGGAVVYDGPLELTEHKPPTTALTSRTVVGSHSFCGSDGCSTGGRLQILPLTGLTAGAPLQITVHLPATGGDFRVESASVQIRAK
ncbi:MAG: hypothetical protein ABIO70_07935 [Pseudomonadota bacterium]